jgi:hypothetical protein
MGKYAHIISSYARELMRSKLSALLLMLVVSGCVATGPKFDGHQSYEVQTEALVYFYRPANALDAAGAPIVSLDSQVFGKLKVGGYLVRVVPVGNSGITATALMGRWGFYKSRTTEPTKILPSETVYFRLLSPSPNEGRRDLEFARVSEAEGSEQVQYLRVSE